MSCTKRAHRSVVPIALTFALLATLALTGCGTTKTNDTNASDNAAQQTGTIAIEGSDTMVNLAQAWAESYMATKQGVTVTVKGGGSGGGIASLLNGTVDYADASRELKEEEQQAAQDAGLTVAQTAVAKDGIAVIVNKANGVTGLTTDQLGKIYRGEITDWSQVGGKAGKIVLLGRDTSSGTYEFFSEAVVGKDAKYAKTMRSMQSSQAIVDEVKGNPAAIGYVGMGYEDPAIKVLEVDGVAATVASVTDGTYALSRELYMDSTKTNALGKAYLTWILGTEGQKIVEQEGFVPLKAQ